MRRFDAIFRFLRDVVPVPVGVMEVPWVRSLSVMAGFLFLFSCAEIVDIPLGSMDPVLVVDAKLTTDTASHVVKLNRSCDYYDPDVNSTAVSGAEVYVLADDGQRIDYYENVFTPGRYCTSADVYGEIGKNYTLHIEADADGDGVKELYEAESRMPSIPRIDSVRPLY